MRVLHGHGHSGGHGHGGGSGEVSESVYRWHGVCMIAAWALLAPTGVVVSRLCRSHAWWFKVHRAVQSLAVLLAVAGLVIIVEGINVAGISHMHGGHTYLGAAVIALALLQPAVALARPHAPEGEEAKSAQRLWWERLHRTTGYVLLVIALVNVFTGITNGHVKGTHVPDQLWPLVGVCLACVVVAAVIAGRSATNDAPGPAAVAITTAPPKKRAAT